MAKAMLAAVWAVDDGEKLFREDTESPLKGGNSVWQGKTVRLFSARNEVVAFQLILQAGPAGAETVEVRVSDLRNGASTLHGSHPLPPPNDTRGVSVELFTEHYLHLPRPSWDDPNDGGFYTTTIANPNLTGWIPDALIPFSAKSGKGGAPFFIDREQDQGVWVDVYVPRDASPGTYRGAITVTVEGVTEAEVPLELEVLPFALPDENHYRSMVYYSEKNLAARHGVSGAALREMVLRYHRMAHRHRIELIGEGTWEELQALGGTLTGTAFTPAEGYEGPGEGIGNTLFSVHTYGYDLPQDEAGYREFSDRWVTWFREHAPRVEYFLYLTDEPRPQDAETMAWVRERTGWIKDNPGPGRALPVLITVQPHETLVGAVDVWCTVTVRYPVEEVEAARRRGERVWLYCGIRPGTPTDMIDEHGISFRLKPWIAHQFDVPRWFTWESTHWHPNHNEVPNDRPKNVFVDPATFTVGTPAGTGFGDGTLFYPGQDAVFPEEDRGYPGPLSSIRMKMYRRGIQDVEYMWLAEQAGYGEEVRALVAARYPTTPWAPEPRPRWATDNASCEQARRRMAELVGTRG